MYDYLQIARYIYFDDLNLKKGVGRNRFPSIKFDQVSIANEKKGLLVFPTEEIHLYSDYAITASTILLCWL